MDGNKGQLAIKCMGLTRRFGNFTAVDGLSLTVKKGELFGFLGPNGAGKTTTISMLTTLIKPSAGNAIVAGFDLKDEGSRVRSRIGVVPQQFSLFEELTPVENLWYIGELYEMDREVVRKRTDEILKIVTLYDKRDVPAGTFSGGMKQRLSVAATRPRRATAITWRSSTQAVNSDQGALPAASASPGSPASAGSGSAALRS